jgi:hypothetical protein
VLADMICGWQRGSGTSGAFPLHSHLTDGSTNAILFLFQIQFHEFVKVWWKLLDLHLQKIIRSTIVARKNYLH